MHKEEFVKNKFTEFIDDLGYDLNQPLTVEKECQLDINPMDFYDFMEKNWLDCYCLPYEPRPNLDYVSNQQAQLAKDLGYYAGNSLKRDWGKNNPKHDEIFKEILGQKNFDLIEMDPKTTLIRLLCFTPGNILPLHWDQFEGWTAKFGIKDKQPRRLLTMVNEWSWGQYVQIHDKFITNWKAGDTWGIPEKVLHCSGNGGIVPKITMTITGI